MLKTSSGGQIPNPLAVPAVVCCVYKTKVKGIFAEVMGSFILFLAVSVSEFLYYYYYYLLLLLLLLIEHLYSVLSLKISNVLCQNVANRKHLFEKRL